MKKQIEELLNTYDKQQLEKAIKEMLSHLDKKIAINNYKEYSMLTFAIDLDGTITQTDEYPKFGAVNEDAVSVINELYNAGHYIIIWTCRDNIVDVEDYLRLNKIKHHKINMNNPDSIQKYLSDPRKIGADYYIDDKALSLFNKKIDWQEIRTLLEEKGIL